MPLMENFSAINHIKCEFMNNLVEVTYECNVKFNFAT
jgi:hypothetical protein